MMRFMPKSSAKPASGSVDEQPQDRGQRSIQSVEIGFKLIRVLEEAPDALSLKDLAAAAGLTPSKAHLYLVSFRRVGLVTQTEGSRYTLGPYALQLGLSTLMKLDVARIARDPLRELSRMSGEACYLAVWGNRGPCIIQRIDGPGPLPMSLQVGFVLPVMSTATGRVFLSYLPRPRTAPVLAAEQSVGWGVGASDKAVAEVIDETRAAGMARTDSLSHLGFSALSAPVFAHDGEVNAAITLIGSSSSFDSALDGGNARHLRTATQSVSAGLGWSGSARP